MINKFKPISISLSPNVQKDDVALALKLLFQPWKWQRGIAIQQLQEQFKKYVGTAHAVSFNSGRSSLYAILKTLNLQQGDGVLLQAFTCNAVVNPILWAGLTPMYVDCADDFNIDLQDLKKKITLRNASGHAPKALIVQYTFGLPANITEIIALAKQYGLLVIEDCAHALGAQYNGRQVGTFGDVAFFSFSRDKVISSVYGGMATTNNPEIGKKLHDLQKKMGQPGLIWVKQQLLHSILLHFIILPLYYFFDFGKLFLVASQWLHVLSKAVSWKEKRGLRPSYFPKALPNALAAMALHQFHKLPTFSAHRLKIAEFYYQELQGTTFIVPNRENSIFLRFAVQHPNAHEILFEAWSKENILLGDWYRSPIDPHDTKLQQMSYETGMCPNAEALARRTLNLPTHINITMDAAKRITTFLKRWK